jgi:DNA modification methylase
MGADIPDGSVALVVTSPPYFAGKEYEEAMGEGHIPGSYVEYLKLLKEVFAECKRKLEPGGRMAVNVANLGRKPYRSLAADIITILQDELKLLLRGEVIWIKGKSPGNSCAWGSFQSAANPVLRDTTERVILSSKGRFDRALSRRKRARGNLPSEVSISKDEFIESTSDVWYMQPESAHRVNHPAPFPVELPERLIHLYTYRGDLVLDPFIGSGTTAVAAVRTERHYLGYETDPAYKEIAEERVERERARKATLPAQQARRVSLPAVRDPNVTEDEDFQARAVREGRQAKEIGRMVLENAGFQDIKENQKMAGGVEVNFTALDADGRRWLFDVSGAFTSSRAGLRRTDTLWKALGKAAVLHSTNEDYYKLVFLTTDVPERGSAGDAALRAARGGVFHDVIEMLSPEGQKQLSEFAGGGSLMSSSFDSSRESIVSDE